MQKKKKICKRNSDVIAKHFFLYFSRCGSRTECRCPPAQSFANIRKLSLICLAIKKSFSSNSRSTIVGYLAMAIVELIFDCSGGLPRGLTGWRLSQTRLYSSFYANPYEPFALMPFSLLSLYELQLEAFFVVVCQVKRPF